MEETLQQDEDRRLKINITCLEDFGRCEVVLAHNPFMNINELLLKTSCFSSKTAGLQQ